LMMLAVMKIHNVTANFGMKNITQLSNLYFVDFIELKQKCLPSGVSLFLL